MATRDFAGYYAPEKIGKTRRLTPEGWLVLEGTPIARTGEQIYGAHELEGIAPNAQGFIVVERRAEEVFKPESLASLEGKDYVIEHPPNGVDTDNWKNHTVGHVQNVRRGEGVEDDLVLADIFVKDPEAIVYVNKHLPENSVGYNADYEQIEPGRAFQKNIIGNHVAGVQAGRAGSRVAVRDHLTTGDSSMDRKTFGALIKERLVKLGIRSADADTLTAELQDVTLSTSDSEEGEVMKRLEGMDAVLKKVSDWQSARDAKEEKEEIERKEAADKAVRDAAEAEEKRKNSGAEAEEAEKIGDTILEAEGTGKVINLGKTWTGGMTGDSAEPVLAGVVSRAEVLAPGITKPTADSVKGSKGVVLATFMRTALERHTADASGKENVTPFLMGRRVSDLKGMDLVAVFNGATQLAKARNNRGGNGTVIAHRATGDFSRPKSVAEINEANKKFWKDRAAG